MLQDFVEEKDLIKYKKSKSPQVSENELDMNSKLGEVFEKIRSENNIKMKNSAKYSRELMPPLDLYSFDQKEAKKHLILALDDVNFNVLDLDPMDLHFTIYHLFSFFNFFDKYQVDLKTWQEFIWVLERKYNIRQNPFHNFYHATTGLLIFYLINSSFSGPWLLLFFNEDCDERFHVNT